MDILRTCGQVCTKFLFYYNLWSELTPFCMDSRLTDPSSAFHADCPDFQPLSKHEAGTELFKTCKSAGGGGGGL